MINNREDVKKGDVDMKDVDLNEVLKTTIGKVASHFNLTDREIVRYLKEAIRQRFTLFELLNEFECQKINSIYKNFFKNGSDPNCLPRSCFQDLIVNRKYLSLINEKDMLFNKTNLGDKYALTAARRIPFCPKGTLVYGAQRCQFGECKAPATCNMCVNDSEFYFHPLIYKTKFCRIEGCNEPKCSFAHYYSQEFRFLFDYDDPKNKRLLNALKISDFNRYLEQLEYPEEVEEFSLATYKVFPCPLKQLCRWLVKGCSKKCYYFHSEQEKRRNPFIYQYTNYACRNAVFENSFLDKVDCEFEEFCSFAHTSNELLYHPKNFRNLLVCQRIDKESNECEFGEVCYGKHIMKKDEAELLARKVNKLNRILNDLGKKCDLCGEFAEVIEVCKCSAFTCWDCRNVYR